MMSWRDAGVTSRPGGDAAEDAFLFRVPPGSVPEHVLEAGDDLTPREEALRGDFIYEPEPE